jgi:hypothetical protein
MLGIGIQPNMLDPDPYQMNTDPKHCKKSSNPYCSHFSPVISGNAAYRGGRGADLLGQPAAGGGAGVPRLRGARARPGRPPAHLPPAHPSPVQERLPTSSPPGQDLPQVSPAHFSPTCSPATSPPSPSTGAATRLPPRVRIYHRSVLLTFPPPAHLSPAHPPPVQERLPASTPPGQDLPQVSRAHFSPVLPIHDILGVDPDPRIHASD